MTEVILPRFESNYTTYSRSIIDDYQFEKTVWLTSMCASMIDVIYVLCGFKKATLSHKIFSFTHTKLYNKLSKCGRPTFGNWISFPNVKTFC